MGDTVSDIVLHTLRFLRFRLNFSSEIVCMYPDEQTTCLWSWFAALYSSVAGGWQDAH